MKKAKELVKELVSKSIPVSQQTFDFRDTGEKVSDQYIVDGPALRELLRAYRWKYKKIRKHKDWVSTFRWNGTETPALVNVPDSEDPDARAIFAGVGLAIIILSALIYALFF